jgi:hypothetical protein
MCIDDTRIAPNSYCDTFLSFPLRRSPPSPTGRAASSSRSPFRCCRTRSARAECCTAMRASASPAASLCSPFCQRRAACRSRRSSRCLSNARTARRSPPEMPVHGAPSLWPASADGDRGLVSERQLATCFSRALLPTGLSIPPFLRQLVFIFVFSPHSYCLPFAVSAPLCKAYATRIRQ